MPLPLKCNKTLIRFGVFFGLLGLAYVYQAYNPLDSAWFPKCPFKSVTGYECAGCGSQRAVHHLLNLEFKSAFKENPLLVLSIPYILLGWIIDGSKNPSQRMIKMRKTWYGLRATYIVLGIVLSFWVLRNLI